MNEVILNGCPPTVDIYLPGDLFINSEGDKCLYLLCRVNPPNWVAVCLQDGCRWCDPVTSPELAIEGLAFYKRSAKITIS